MGLTAEEQAIKEAFIEDLGFWGETWDVLLGIDPSFVTAYHRLHMVPVKKGHLTPKFRALCSLAVSAAATHLHVPGSPSTFVTRSIMERLPARWWRCSNSSQPSAFTP